ncbi:MAG: PEP-CTERM sorting domain-containing protein [Acidobacteria bacterium]|nr:PEP-CTERM sorting domain-containing protein [Acidobacteriota bacterium]
MKKSLLAFSLMAFGCLQLSAAPCVPGTLASLAALGAGGCEITNGPNTWNLNTFGFSAGNPTFTNYAGQGVQTTSNFNVSFALNPTNFSGGFSVTLTPTVSNYFGFTAGATSNGAQQFNMESTFRIANNTGSALITRVGGSIDGAAASVPVVGVPNPAVTLQKYIQQLSNTSLQSILQPDTSSLPGSAYVITPPTAFNPALLTEGVGSLVIVDRLRLDGGNTIGNSASLASYTNYFAPAAVQTGIPEPMTFALMGAGLIGLAVLRRRK